MWASMLGNAGIGTASTISASVSAARVSAVGEIGGGVEAVGIGLPGRLPPTGCSRTPHGRPPPRPALSSRRSVPARARTPVSWIRGRPQSKVGTVRRAAVLPVPSQISVRPV